MQIMRELTQKDYVDNVALIHKVARGCFARLQAIGVALDYDDVFQELSLTFVKAWRQFDSNKGYQFSTYFVVGARHEFNRFVAKAVAERVEHGVRSLEEMNDWADGDGSLTIEETISGGDLDQVERLLVIERMEQLSKSLSPLSKLVLEWLVTPPAELEREVVAGVRHAHLSRATHGVMRRARTDVSIGSILAFIKMIDPAAVSNDEVVKTRKELNKLMEIA